MRACVHVCVCACVRMCVYIFIMHWQVFVMSCLLFIFLDIKHIFLYLEICCLILWLWKIFSLQDSVLSPVAFTLYYYRDQPWFSVVKHSMDHEEGV